MRRERAKPVAIKPSVPGSGVVAARNLPSVNTKPAGNSSEAGTKVQVEQNFPPAGVCRLNCVKNSEPALPVNEVGVKAGWHPVKVDPTVAFVGRRNPPEVVSARNGFRSRNPPMSCPSITTSDSPRNI